MFLKLNKAVNVIRCAVNSIVQKTRERVLTAYVKAACATSGEMYVDTAAKVLIACVIGMLLLVSFYALYKNNIIPNVTNKANDMFNYSA
jgi:hypothetical protein